MHNRSLLISKTNTLFGEGSIACRPQAAQLGLMHKQTLLIAPQVFDPLGEAHTYYRSNCCSIIRLVGIMALTWAIRQIFWLHAILVFSVPRLLVHLFIGGTHGVLGSYNFNFSCPKDSTAVLISTFHVGTNAVWMRSSIRSGRLKPRKSLKKFTGINQVFGKPLTQPDRALISTAFEPQHE